MYTLIKLNTRNGVMRHVQWGIESKYLFESTISDIPLVNENEEQNGRFFLYPISNIYNFILLDQITGKIWQVQREKKEKDLFYL